MLRTLIGRVVAGCLAVSGMFAASAAAQTVRLYDTDYVAAASVGRAAGLASHWVQPQRRLVLADKDTRLELSADSREIELDGLRVFLGEPAVLHRNALFVSRVDRDRFLLPILKPSSGRGPVPPLRTIVIDPGHGGKDGGTSNAKLKLREKTLTLDVALRLEKLLTAAGYRVVLTRRRDTFVPLPLRPAHAKKVKADLFLSIHFNAIGNKTVTGCETYILTPQHQRSTGSDKRSPDDKVLLPGNADDNWNAILGFRMHGTLVRSLRAFDRGLKRARFAVLRDLDCPGVLIEGGYLSNDAEARKIATPAWRQQLAQSIADGVVGYRAALAEARR